MKLLEDISQIERMLAVTNELEAAGAPFVPDEISRVKKAGATVVVASSLSTPLAAGAHERQTAPAPASAELQTSPEVAKETPAAVPKAKTAPKNTITPQPGESLSVISAIMARKTPEADTANEIMNKLILANKIKNPDLIYAKKPLIVPGDVNYKWNAKSLPNTLAPAASSPVESESVNQASVSSETSAAPAAVEQPAAPQPPEAPAAHPKKVENIAAIPSIKGVRAETIQETYKYLREKHGFTSQAAAETVGMFLQESSLNPAAENKKEGAISIWQARGNRKVGMPDDIPGQTDHMVADMQKDPLSVKEKVLETMKDPEASVEEVREQLHDFIRYGDVGKRHEFGATILGAVQTPPAVEQPAPEANSAAPQPEAGAPTAAPEPAPEAPAPEANPVPPAPETNTPAPSETPAPEQPAPEPTPPTSAPQAPEKAPEAPKDDKKPESTPKEEEGDNNNEKAPSAADVRSADELSDTDIQDTPDTKGYVVLHEDPRWMFESFAPPEDRRAKPETVQLAIDFATHIHEKYPGYKVRFGDFNAKKGHKSHKHGQDFDFDIVGPNGLMYDYTKQKTEGYNRAGTIEVGKFLLSTGKVDLLFYNDPEVINELNKFAFINKLPGKVLWVENHANHGHIRVATPKGPRI